MVHLDISTARGSLDLELLDTIQDADIRSPRTPIYQPTSPFSSTVSPFDLARFFARSSPSTPETIAPKKQTLPPPPSDPLAWVWQCHLCRSRWTLGVTRRCLVDGHFYCSGETSQPNLKKKKKGQSCSSEFDYVGWKDWGAWKRNVFPKMSSPQIPKGCERCEFPSQCRYGPTEKELNDGQPSHSPMTGVEYTSTTAEVDAARYYSGENVTFESILAEPDATGKSVQSKMTDFYKTDQSLKRSMRADSRAGDKIAKSIQGQSSKKIPLSPIAEEAPKRETGTELQDLVMPLVDV